MGNVTNLTPASGSSFAVGAVITVRVTYDFVVADAQLNNYTRDSVPVVYGNSNGGYLEDNGKTWVFEIPDYTLSTGTNEFGAQAWPSSGGKATEAKFTYNIITITNCGAPTTVTINGSSSAVTTTTPEITLEWSGAKGGTNNPITGYYISYDISTNGSTWDTEYEYDVILSTSTSGKETMNFLSKGTYYRFKVLTIGSIDGGDSTDVTMSPVVYYSPSLPVIFNGTQLTKIIYNGTEISSLVYNGTKLF